MCSPICHPLPASWWPVCLLPAWALSRVTTTAWTLSAAAMRWPCRPPSSPLMKLHVRTLQLNPNAVRRPRYAMRTPQLRLVPHD